MEKEVLVSGNGMQFVKDDDNSIEFISPGTYYYKNDKHYIMYEDSYADGSETVTNVLKISNDKAEPRVELIKKGGIGAHLIFERNKNNISCYETSYGSFVMGFQSKNIIINHYQDEINVKIEYSLEMNYEHVSDNKIEMKIRSKSCMESLSEG